MVIVPPVHSFASPTALDLGQRIVNAVQEYRQTHPGTSDEDVREALRIASMNGPAGGRRGARVAILAATAAAVAVTLLIWRQPAHRVPFPTSVPFILLAVTVLAILVAVRGRR
jgi:hypothetical protein